MHRRNLSAAALLLAFMVALSLFVAACGGGDGGEDLLERELPENATPEKIMLEGLNATDEARSLEYIFDYAFVIPPTGEQTYTSEVRLEGEGYYDAETGNVKARMLWPAFELEFDYLLYGGNQYFRQNAEDVWKELPQGSNMAVPSISEITRNTSEYMDNFQKITRLEDETVIERDCYHIAMVPNFDAIMENQQFLDMLRGDQEQLDEEKMAELEGIKEQLKEASVNYEYWIDKEFLVLRRTLYNIEMVMPGDEQTSSYTVKLIMEMDFPQYNAKVDINPPQETEPYQEPSD